MGASKRLSLQIVVKAKKVKAVDSFSLREKARMRG
jgi:hypothetical protein